MCGIAGLFDTRGQRDFDPSLVERMNNSQFHRGPDGQGMHLEPGVALAHRRLAVSDLFGGQQPVFNENQSVCAVFDGTIYNYQALVTELKALGYVFKTQSDAEVIIHGWTAWGEACVEHLRGVFSFAVSDRKQGTLFLARDRLGVKPLFYALLNDGTLAFGSELKVLKMLSALDRRLDPYAIETYFAFGYVAEPHTIFMGAKKLDAAHTLLVHRGEPVPASRSYWDIHFTLDNPLSLDEATEELTGRLRESVKLCMVSDAPLGAFLSGGVDSSAVVALMAGLSGTPVNTCSIAFEDPAFNESEYAEKVADRYQTRHFVETVKPDDFELIDTLALLYDEPYADSSAIPTYRLCQLASRQFKVALSGDGGDENFGGYRRYRLHLQEERWRSFLPYGIRHPLFGLLGKLYPDVAWAPRVFRAKSTFQALARDAVAAYCHEVSTLRDEMHAQFFSDAFLSQLGSYRAIEVFRHYADNVKTDDALALIQYLDLKTYALGDINTKVDRASMAHSLSVRAPLMDHLLTEWLATLPSALKIHAQEGKYLFKKAMEPFLPADVLYRRKMGFAVPLAHWFRGPLKQRIRDALFGEALASTGYFKPATLRYLVEAHQSGGKDYSALLWALLMFESFIRSERA